MLIKSLLIQNFRSFKQFHLNFEQTVTLIVGPNASGKTSIIEAIYLLASGHSFRAIKIEEMIRFGQELARVGGLINGDDAEETQLEVTLTRGMVAGRRTRARHFQVNQVKRRKRDLVGQLLAVVFRPEDMRLVEGSKTRRRHFIDSALCLVDQQYDRSLRVYEEALRKRNKLLFQIREGEMPKSVLHYWNNQLIEHGQFLQTKRAEFLEFFAQVKFPVKFTAEYLKSEISRARLDKYARQEVAAGHTLIGPHKDDLAVRLAELNSGSDHTNVAIYGSRGQQRLAVLWLKVCEFEYLAYKTGRRPVLLLDDVLSELDHDSRNHVLNLIDGKQVIITTTEKRVVDELKKVTAEVQVIAF